MIKCSTEDESVIQNNKNVDINPDVVDLLSELISSTEESSCDMDTSHFPNCIRSKNVKKTQNAKSKLNSVFVNIVYYFICFNILVKLVLCF